MIWQWWIKLPDIAFRYAWARLVTCAVERVLPSLDPSRDALKRCSEVSWRVVRVPTAHLRNHWLRRRLRLHIVTPCTLQWNTVTPWRVAESPAQSQSLRPTSSSKPFWTVSPGSRRRQVCCVPLRYRINCSTARLLSVVGLRTCVDWCWMSYCMSLSPRYHEDVFFDGCAKVGVIVTIQWNSWRELRHCRASSRIDCRCRVLQPVHIQKGTPRGLYCSSPQNRCVSWWSQDLKSWLCRLRVITPPRLPNTDKSSRVQNRSWDVLRDL